LFSSLSFIESGVSVLAFVFEGILPASRSSFMLTRCAVYCIWEGECSEFERRSGPGLIYFSFSAHSRREAVIEEIYTVACEKIASLFFVTTSMKGVESSKIVKIASIHSAAARFKRERNREV
jgi:hypothetical protein